MEQGQGVAVKKITANEALIRMIRAVNADDRVGFYKIADEYINTLSKGGSYYYDMKRWLNEKPMKLLSLDELPTNVKHLVSKSIIEDDNVFLNDNIKELIDGLLIEWANTEVYRYHNLGVRNRVLLHGETGNGKTTIAKHIAKLTDLPFVEINADAVVDSKLGSSGTNIYNVFKEIKQPCVLFWDEIDGIGAKRTGTDNSAGHENNRMVNSLLVNLDKLDDKVIFIGATNRLDILDVALLRRFSVRFELSAPSDIERGRFARQMSDYYKLPENYVGDYQSWKCKNYSDIKDIYVQAARKYVLSMLKAQTDGLSN